MQDVGQHLIAALVQMDAVDGQWFIDIGIGLPRGIKQVDEGDLHRLRHFAHRLRVEGESPVIGGPVGQGGAMEVFVSNR